MSLKLESHWYYSIGHIIKSLFILVVYLALFPTYYCTFTIYVAACDLNSFAARPKKYNTTENSGKQSIPHVTLYHIPVPRL